MPPRTLQRQLIKAKEFIHGKKPLRYYRARQAAFLNLYGDGMAAGVYPSGNRANHVRLLACLSFSKRAHKIGRDYQFWQEGVHAELTFSEAMMREKLKYIHTNPVKRGYVELPEHWRYSSARNYEGWRT
jgi:hypothetical protein